MNLTGYTGFTGDIRKPSSSNLSMERSEAFIPKNESFNSMLEKAVTTPASKQDEERYSSKDSRNDINDRKDEFENKSDKDSLSSKSADASSETNTRKTARDKKKDSDTAAVKQDNTELQATPDVKTAGKNDASKKSEEHDSAVKSDAPAKKQTAPKNEVALNNILMQNKKNINADTKNISTTQQHTDSAEPKDVKKKAIALSKNNLLPLKEKPLQHELHDKALTEKISNAVKNINAGSKSKNAAITSDTKAATAERAGAENTAKEAVNTLPKDMLSFPNAVKESGDSSQSSFMKNFGHQISENPVSSKTGHAGQILNPFADKLDEIMSQAKVTVRDAKNAQLSIRLNPEHLGRMNVSFGIENGILSAKFLVESSEAKEALLANFNDLKEALSNEGIALGAFQVDVRGDSNFKARENSEEKTLHYSKVKTDTAETEYQAGQSISHAGSINLIA